MHPMQVLSLGRIIQMEVCILYSSGVFILILCLGAVMWVDVVATVLATT